MLVAVAAFMTMQFTTTEVGFRGVDGFELKGTFVEPMAAKNVPAVLLLPGSGPTDRDGNTPLLPMKVDNLKQIAESLASVGIASLRFDKRAIHSYSDKWPKDMGEIAQFFSWEHFVGDAKLAYEFLKTQPGVDASRVGVLGHSEGALIALRVACDPAENVKALIMVGGQGRPLDVVISQQLREKLPQQLPADQVPIYMDYATRAMAQIKKDATIPPDPPAGLKGLFNPSTLVFLHQNFQDDPAALASQFKGDALVVNGEFDNQISAELDAKALYTAFAERKVGDVKLVIVPGASHALKSTPNRETDAMEGPMVPLSLKAIDDWCVEHLKG